MNRSGSHGGDSYRRVKVSKDAYRCGCAWVEGVLVECTLHRQVTEASVREFERGRRGRGPGSRRR